MTSSSSCSALLDISSSKCITSAQPLLYSVYLLPSLHQLEMSCIHVQDLSLLLYCELQEGRNQVYFVPCSFSSTQHIVGIQETFAE